MAIKLADNIQVQAPKPIDSKYLNITVPYTNPAQVCSTIPIGERHQGLTVNVGGVEWWFKNDTTTLVIKEGGGTITGGTNGLGVSSKNLCLGGTLLNNTVFDGGVSLYNLRYNDDYSSNFTNRSLIDKEYADNIVSGLRPKAAVKVATIGNLTYPFTGLTAIDSQSITNGDRILVKNQTISGNTNGVWIASASTWTRATDFDGTPFGEVVSGSYMWVLSGTTNANTSWVLDTPDPIYVGTTPLNFVLFSHVSDVTAGTGITVNTITGTHQINLNVPTQNLLAVTLTGTTGSYIGTSARNVCLNSTSQAILGGALTGATNGLGLSGRNVCLGGTMNSSSTIWMCNNALVRFQGCNNAGSILNLGNPNVSPQYVYAGLAYNSSLTCGGYIRIYCDATSQIGSQSGITSKSACFNYSNGWIYDADYSSSNTNNPRWIPDKGYVTGLTSSISVPVTGATNGLHLGNKMVALGGNLTGDTFIDLCSNDFKIYDDISTQNLLFNMCNVAEPFVELAAQYGITCCASFIVRHDKAELLNNGNPNFIGFNYANGFTTDVTLPKTCSIPDIAWVTGHTASVANIVNVCNVTSNYTTISSDNFIGVSGATVIYLYNTPLKGQKISIADIKGNALSNPVTICSGSNTINGVTDTCSTINTDYGSITFIYNQYFWSTVAFIN